MTPREVLIKVRDEILTDESRWLQFQSAKGKRKGVDARSPSAICWCLNGALVRVAGYAEGYSGAGKVLDALVPGDDYIEYNDALTTTFEDIRALLDKAIEAAS